jgi:hypothetical protein
MARQPKSTKETQNTTASTSADNGKKVVRRVRNKENRIYYASIHNYVMLPHVKAEVAFTTDAKHYMARLCQEFVRKFAHTTDNLIQYSGKSVTLKESTVKAVIHTLLSGDVARDYITECDAAYEKYMQHKKSKDNRMSLNKQAGIALSVTTTRKLLMKYSSSLKRVGINEVVRVASCASSFFRDLINYAPTVRDSKRIKVSHINMFLAKHMNKEFSFVFADVFSPLFVSYQTHKSVLEREKAAEKNPKKSRSTKSSKSSSNPKMPANRKVDPKIAAKRAEQDAKRKAAKELKELKDDVKELAAEAKDIKEKGAKIIKSRTRSPK